MAITNKGKVLLPEKGIIVRRSGKYHYVYKVLRTYRTESGQPTNERKPIGKLDIESGLLIPNSTYWELYSDTSVPEFFPTYESVRSIGATFLFSRILKDLGVMKILEAVFSAKKSSVILTAVIYMICRGNVFERVLDWCEGFTFNEAPLSSTTSSELFASIDYNERMSFFKKWVSIQPHNESLAYDVTSFSTYSTGVNDAEWGYNRDKEKLPQINLGCYVGQESRLPLFYVTYPGSITDKTHLPYMMAYNDDLGIKDVCFIMDRGFCKTDNILYMHSTQKSYICGAELGHKAASAALRGVRDDIISMRNVTSQGVYAHAIHSRFYGAKSTLHIYFDSNSAERQRQDLYHTIIAEDEELAKLDYLTKKEAKRYRNHFNIDRAEDGTFKYERNYDKIDDNAKNCGFFGIFTNTNSNSEDVLSVYRRKDVIEKSFDELKNHIDMKRLRTHKTETTDGKMFCAFIALIAVSQMTNMLSELMKSKSMSKDGLISELEKIKIVTMTDGTRLMNPITKTQRTIFQACNLFEDDLKAYVDDI